MDRSNEMFIDRKNFTGPNSESLKRLEISSLNQSRSAAEEAPPRKSSTWMISKIRSFFVSLRKKQGSEIVVSKPMSKRASLNVWYHKAPACFVPYKALQSLHTLPGSPWSFAPGGILMNRLSVSMSAFKKAVEMSPWKSTRAWSAMVVSRSRTRLIFGVGAKVWVK